MILATKFMLTQKIIYAISECNLRSAPDVMSWDIKKGCSIKQNK